MKRPIEALIVDDEPLARRRIRALLKEHSEIRIVGECRDGREAVHSIIEAAPHLVFLDIQMPQLDGFEVIQTVGVRRMPVVIFVTAYDQYAVRAFEVHAVDYLLKPYDQARFHAAVERAVNEIDQRRRSDLSPKVQSLLNGLQQDKRLRRRILIRESGRVTILKIDQIDWIESAGNYVKLHVGKRSHLLRDTMKGIMQQLDPDGFARIHRTAIVNLERISELRPQLHGDYLVLLHDGTRLPLSRRYRLKLGGLLENL